MEPTESGLGYITEFEYDLDQVVATIGFLRTTVTAIMKDEGAFSSQLYRDYEHVKYF
jgi:hypothetical protein